MHAIHVLGVIAALAFSSAAYAQASTRSEDDKHRKKPTTSSAPPPPKPNPVTRSNEFTRPPYTPRTERDYEPWRANRQPPPPKPSSSTPRTQSVKSTPTPAETPRDPALARCDRYKARMEQVIREEQRGGDPARMKALAAERQNIYQETMRAGC